MKTTMKHLATAAILTLQVLAGNVSANGTEVKTVLTEENETTLRPEKWMTDETIWNVNPALIADFAQEAESGLEIESWMTGDKSWGSSFAGETEPDLELESWMVDDFTWNKIFPETESKLSVESWMINDDIWK